MLHDFSGAFRKGASSDYEAYKWAGTPELDTQSRRYADQFKRGLVKRVLQYFLS